MFLRDSNGVEILKIVLLGDEDSGKTELYKRRISFNDEQLKKNKIIPLRQHEMGFATFSLNNGTKCTLWNMGTGDLEHIVSNYLKNTHNYIICVDLSRNAEHWYESLEFYLKQIKLYGSINVPVTLVATKSDVVPEDNLSEKIALFRETFCKDKRLHAVYITSSKEDKPTLNWKLNKEPTLDTKYDNQPLVVDDIFETTRRDRINKAEEDPIPVFKKTKAITVAELKNLCKKYYEENYSTVPKIHFWRKYCGYDHGSKSIERLARLYEDKKGMIQLEDTVQLTGQEIIACLSPHRITALTHWIRGGAGQTPEPLSRTECVIRDIYRNATSYDSTREKTGLRHLTECNKAITVGELKKFCDNYIGKYNPANVDFWRKRCGFKFGSKSIEKLAGLCKDKKDDTQLLTGQEIIACLSQHRITALNAWANKSTSLNEPPCLSETEHIIRKIYSHAVNNAQELEKSTSVIY